MRLTILPVAAAAALLTSCHSFHDSLAENSAARPPLQEISGQQGGDISRVRGTASRPFTGPSLPSARFNTAKGRYGFGGDYSTSRPDSLVATYDPENFLRESLHCRRHCHYRSSYCYRPSCGMSYYRGCRY